MSVLQRYLYREWLLTFLAVSIVLTVVLLGVFLGELLNDVANGSIPAGLIGTQLLLRFPEAMGEMLPLAAFIAVMWGLGRLYRDQEMAVMRASGFTWPMMMRPLAWLVLPLSVLLAVLQLWVMPVAAQHADRTLEEAFRSAALWGLQAGRFHVLQDGALVIYVESMGEDGRSLENVFIRKREGERDQVWFASEGQYLADPETGTRYLALSDGQVTEGQAGALDYRILRFERNDLRLPQPEVRSRPASLASRTTAELLAARDVESWVELQWRLSPAVAVLVLGLLAVPLAHSRPREGRGGRVVLGILAYALFANAIYMWRAWLADGTLPPWLGIWWVHAVVALATLAWLQRQGRLVARA
ncbi:MAG: LPS export ABC transporter permease LptF [Xanthomonadales bacterium]|nr:LPS export ABC transporter permease LptF [Xanthomonadales bacterium]